MKISKLFHWLYASVMMLPLVVAPVYAIFMHRHNVTNYEVNTGGYEVTEKYQTNEVNDINDLVVGNVYHVNELIFGGDDSTYNFYFNILSCREYFFDFDPDDIFVNEDFTYEYDSNTDNHILFTANYSDSYNNFYFNFTNGNSYISYCYSYTNIVWDSCLLFIDVDICFTNANSLNTFKSQFESFSLNYDGSLPTASTFQSYDYQYNEGLTYNDTDIGSQFIYSIYLPLNKYFNVTNFLGLNNLYSWINTNVFSGTAPLGFNIFYMLLSYWLLVSIFWLVFDVVMYVPNLAHRWLDKASLD